MSTIVQDFKQNYKPVPQNSHSPHQYCYFLSHVSLPRKKDQPKQHAFGWIIVPIIAHGTCCCICCMCARVPDPRSVLDPSRRAQFAECVQPSTLYVFDSRPDDGVFFLHLKKRRKNGSYDLDGNGQYYNQSKAAMNHGGPVTRTMEEPCRDVHFFGMTNQDALGVADYEIQC
jgi:hypothetical protein